MAESPTVRLPWNLLNPGSCSGRYCGRLTNTSECTACPWGYRSQSTSTLDICQPCLQFLHLYDWLYLGFMASLPVLFQLICLTNELLVNIKTAKHNYRLSALNRPTPNSRHPTWCSPQLQILILSLTCICIHVSSSLITIILFPPIGILDLLHCPISHLEDFYAPLFSAGGCLYEVTYPFISIVIVYYFVSALCCTPIYPFVILCILNRPKYWFTYMYYLFYAYPILCLIHCLLSGILYFTFPFVLIFLAFADSLYRFPLLFDYNINYPDCIPRPAFQTVSVLKFGLSNPINLCLPIVINCSCIAYGLVGYFQSVNCYVIFCLFPITFYLTTLPFSHPMASINNRRLESIVQKLMEKTPPSKANDDTN